jgi:hypothetical protein
MTSRRIFAKTLFLFVSFACANFYLIYQWMVESNLNYYYSPSKIFFRYGSSTHKIVTGAQKYEIGVQPKNVDEEERTSDAEIRFVNHNNNNNRLPRGNKPDRDNWKQAPFHVSLPQEKPIKDLVNSEIFHESSIYNETYYQLKLDEALEPVRNSNSSTAWIFFKSWAGLCNQYMMFIGLVILAMKEGHDQIIEESIQWKDTYGQEKYVQHKKLFDIVHWNSFHPHLPRIVRYDREDHPDIKVRDGQENIEGQMFSKAAFLQSNVHGDPFQLAKNPTPLGQNIRQPLNQYKILTRKVDEEDMSASFKTTKTAFEIIIKDAFRPHPVIQSLMDQFIESMNVVPEGERGKQVHGRYMVIHARIEPDMQNHPMCKVRMSFRYRLLMDTRCVYIFLTRYIVKLFTCV